MRDKLKDKKMQTRVRSFRVFISTLLFLLSACDAKPTEVSPQNALLSEPSGDVTVQAKPDQDFVDAAAGFVLDEGGRLKTGSDGRIRLDLSTGTIVRVGPSSLFKLESNTPVDDGFATTISLELGKVWVILNGGKLDVQTASGEATVRGSYMGVTFKDGVIRLTCLEGTCTFHNQTGDYTVPPGSVLECTGPNDTPVITAMSEKDIQEWLTANPEAATIVDALKAAATPTFTATPTATTTLTPTATPTLTATPTQIASLEGEVLADKLSCRYGPGAAYLYAWGLSKGAKVEVIGKAETTGGLWVYVRHQDNDRPCWVNAKFLQIGGDAAALEQVYPEKAALILFYHDKFPPVTNVEAGRTGDFVGVTWVGYELALGDRESEESPLYLVEFWTCQGGQIVFTAYGAFEENALIKDEPGCSEPSHGQVYIAHKDGYIGPVNIPWPGP
jgi:hypothetical protein